MERQFYWPRPVKTEKQRKSPPEYVPKTQKTVIFWKMVKFVKPFGTTGFANMREII
jgi:hypothetical protein